MKYSAVTGYISIALLAVGSIDAATFLDKPSLVTYWGQVQLAYQKASIILSITFCLDIYYRTLKTV
jgi:hypothetical protein